jgi:hypothetical protein
MFWLSGNTNLALPVRMDLIHRNAIFPDRDILTKPAVS